MVHNQKKQYHLGEVNEPPASGGKRVLPQGVVYKAGDGEKQLRNERSETRLMNPRLSLCQD